MVKSGIVPWLVWICITVNVGYDKDVLLASAELLPLCHEEHGRCINDAKFQNCSDGKYVPSILKTDLRNTSVVANRTARFKCLQRKAEAALPLPQFDWIKWNHTPGSYPSLDVDYGSFIDIIRKNPKYKQIPDNEEGLHVNYLIIENVTEDDAGLFTCVICNEFGRDYASAFLSLTHDNSSPVPVTPTQVTYSTQLLALPSTSPSSSQLSERAKIVLGCVGAILCVAIIVVMLFLIWQKKGLKSRGLPIVLYESNSPDEANNVPALLSKQQNGHLPTNQRESLIPLVKNRNSSYRSQLSSAASGGTILTYADDLFEYPLDEKWEVERRSIAMKEMIGEGAFGCVMKAEAYDLPNAPTPCTVAVKMLKENATDAELSDLISEMQTMKDIGTHKNIVNFLGACTVQGPLLLIVEYCPNGNLRDFLRNNRPSLIELTEEPGPQLMIKDLLSFAYQIAKGMSYLSSKKCIHRDLAARNVLISEDFVVKIADFGLSRNLGNTDYYRRTTHGRLPVKWLPVEALFDQEYTVKSDVWSFGIILWEIFTLGGTPYPGIPVERLFTLLKNGYRMESPINCLENVYEMMLECWSESPKFRPSFAQLTTQLDEILSSETRQDYVEVLAKSVDCLAEVEVEDSDENKPQDITLNITT